MTTQCRECFELNPLPEHRCFDALRRATEERVRFVLQNREKLVEAWVAETGLMPSECMLIEQHHQDGRTTVTIRKREEPTREQLALIQQSAPRLRYWLTDPYVCNIGASLRADLQTLLDAIDGKAGT